jgi:hypothetical protein
MGVTGSLQGRQKGVTFEPASGGAGWRKSYADLVDVTVGGPGRQRTGGGFVGGGFDLTGAAEGMVVAGILNALTTTTNTNSLITVAATDSALILHTSTLTPDELRVHLSPVTERIAAAKDLATRVPATPALTPKERLEQLLELKQTGGLTAEEYQTARTRIINAL